ncbi:MAG TPA: hypothetical protein DCZ95_09545 [Verrucomicrobia bacterium]|nr:hypothetical protein [Verrucomicrobiota bacterium]
MKRGLNIFLAAIALMCAAPAHGNGDPLLGLLGIAPKARPDPSWHIAFVEVVSIFDDQIIVTNDSNGAVSYNDGKTWNNLMKMHTGLVRLSVIECIGLPVPATITVKFRSGQYMPAADTPYEERWTKPGRRLLCFLRSGGPDKWELLNKGFLDPIDYLIIPDCKDRLQRLFRMTLAEEGALTQRRQERDAIVQKERQMRAPRNRPDN